TTRRSPGPAADQAGAGRQRQDCEGAGPHDPAVPAEPRRPGDPVTSARAAAHASAFMAIAHRGASSYAPENTFAAVDLALRMGVQHVELDVEATADDHIVVIHDDTVDRTTDGSGPVTGHTLESLRALDAGSWFGAEFAGQRIPLFDEVLARYKD